jgi:hypothetical protein
MEEFTGKIRRLPQWAISPTLQVKKTLAFLKTNY